MTDKNSNVDVQAELARLLSENAKLQEKLSARSVLRFKVSEKGAVSVYGINNKFPLTIYASQMIRLLSRKEDLLAFIEENRSKLAWKEPV
jgi:hypothetical protein